MGTNYLRWGVILVVAGAIVALTFIGVLSDRLEVAPAVMGLTGILYALVRSKDRPTGAAPQREGR